MGGMKNINGGEKYINIVIFFFFKQKTAYEIRLSLVGSEMCIRDSIWSIASMLSGALNTPRTDAEGQEEPSP
ncbi:hypothetical protein AMBR_CKHPCMOK_02852 [Lacticaseibacillus rhamnosus]|nr:hypothetical protein AMBR_CKHPCMOK_02852 [Lacticaseibacillus rhamnosus]